MSLIVEDGTVVESANTFLSLSDARSLADDYGLTISDSDPVASVQLRQAYLALANHEQQLQGSRVSANQTGIYPRSGVEKNCFELASNVIPLEVKLAQIYQVDAINSGSYETNNTDSGDKLASFEVVGAYKESYQTDSNTRLNTTVQGVYNSLYPLTKAGKCGSSGYGSITREEFGFVGR